MQVKRLITLASAVLCAISMSCAAPQETASTPQVPVFDAETFFATTSIFGASFSHDEARLLITSDVTTRRIDERSLIAVNRAGERARQKVLGFVIGGIGLEFRLRHLHGFG